MEITDIINNVNVYGLEESIRGAKFPMATDVNKLNSELTNGIKNLGMCEGGTGHCTWLAGVIVHFDLTFTVKAWTEAERYHFLEFVSSQSTVHRITRFDLDKAYIEYVDPRMVEIMKEKVAAYNALVARSEEGDNSVKDEMAQKYLEILYSNPCGCKLTARMVTNYLQLKNIYKQRKNHRLPEWRVFCRWLDTLPHSEFITGVDKNAG